MVEEVLEPDAELLFLKQLRRLTARPTLENVV